MATQEQLAALQKILNIAQKAGLNNEEEKYSVGTLDEFDKHIDEITKNNTRGIFLIYFNIDNIAEMNQEYSKMVSDQICSNVLSSIQSVAKQQFSKYNLSIYKICDNKTAVLVRLTNNKTENIMKIKEISTSIETMISVSCGTKSTISIGVIARQNNENKSSLISRTDLLLQKKDCIIAYDCEYFAVANDNLFADIGFNISGNEIITVCVGGSGTNIGNEFYKLLMNEHKIECKTGEFMGNLNNEKDNVLLDKSNVYFNYKKDKYTPRAVFIDLDMENLNKLKNGYLGSLIDIDSFCGYSGDAKTNKLLFPQGYYTIGKEIFENAKNIIRSTAELCDNMQGFNIFHCINGGTGGGLTSLLQTALRDDYPDKIFANFCVYPTDDNTNDGILSNYNSLLTLKSLETDIIFPINNRKLNEIAIKKLNLDKESIKYSDYNWLISLVLSGVTSPFRFYGEPEVASNLRKMYMTFALHTGPTHLSMSHSPFINNNKTLIELSASQIKSEIISKINNISFYHKSNKIDMIKDGKIIQLMTVYKSNNDTIINDLDNKLRSLTGELMDNKLEIDPMPFQSTSIIHSYYNTYTPLISTSIIHSTAILKIYKNMKSIFKTNINGKKMLSQYLNQGMDNYEFVEADKNINQLIDKYKKYQDSKIVDSDDEKDEHDDDDEDY